MQEEGLSRHLLRRHDLWGGGDRGWGVLRGCERGLIGRVL